MADFTLSAKIRVTEAQLSAKAREALKGIKIQFDTGRAGRQIKGLSERLMQARREAANLARALKTTGLQSKKLQKVKKEADKVAKSLQQGTQSGRDMVTMFEVIGRRALAFRVAATFINTFTDSVSDAATFLKDLDQILADIAKISGQTAAELAAVGDELVATAIRWGAVIEDVAGQMRIFVQAGFDATTALEMAERATIGAAATTLDLNQASEVLIQTMKVFGGIESDQVFNKIAIAESTAAASARDMQEALKRSAATFKVVNASLSDSIGLIAALQETSRRGGAVVGTAFRTINTRIFAGDTRKAVEDLGVAVSDQLGNLRPLVDVLSDLQVKFKSLTESERVQAATVIAGRRQFESFMQIINNVDRAQAIAASTMQEYGEDIKRAGIQAETLGSVLEKLRSAFVSSVREATKFVPIIETFKGLASALTDVLTAADGAVGKIALLSGLLIGAKAVIPAFKGLGRLLGGLGGAIPNLLKGGAAAGAAGGAMLGGAAGTSLTRKVVGQLRIANIGLAAIGLTATAFSSTIKDTDTVLKATAKDALEFGGAMTTAFAFGPIIGSIVGIGASTARATKAIVAYNDRVAAASASMEEFGSVTLAKMEAALVDVSAKGDKAAADLLRFAIDFEKAANRFKETDVRRSVVAAVGGIIDQMKDLAPGVEVESAELWNKIITTLQEQGFSTQEANALLGDIKTQKSLFEDLGFTIRNSAVAGASAWNQFVKELNEELSALQREKFSIDINQILDSEKFIQSTYDLADAFRESRDAERVLSQGITDTMKLRKLQSEQELQGAERAVSRQRALFSLAIKQFSDEFGDGDLAGSLQNFFDQVSGGGITMANSVNTLQQFRDLLTEMDVSGEKINERSRDVILQFLALEKGLLEFNNALVKNETEIRKINLDELIQNFQEMQPVIDATQEAASRLAGVGIAIGDLGDVDTIFTSVTQSLSDLDADELLQFMGVMQDIENPIIRARQALYDNISLHEMEIDNLSHVNRELRKYISLLEEQPATTERDAEIKKKNNEIEKNSIAIQQERSRALVDIIRDTRKASSAQKKAIKDVVEAQDKFIDSLESLREEITEASIDAYVDSQNALQDAQVAVIDSAEALSDSYDDLREAQYGLNDAIGEYRIGVGMAAREADIITGRLRGFTDQLSSIQNVYDEILSTTVVSEAKRLELLRQSASEQLALVQSAIDETKSIGARLFTAGPGEGAALQRGFASLREVISQFQAAGGFGGIDLNAFGNQLLALPQSMRQEMAKALSMLPETATLGGLSKDEIESILFGAAVGESQEANIQNINDLTEKQVELIQQIAELNSHGIMAANAQLMEAEKQVALAEAQLDFDKIALERAEENALVTRDEIREASNVLSAVQENVGVLLSGDINVLKDVGVDNITSRLEEHKARLSVLQTISANTTGLVQSISALGNAIGVVGATTAATGHIPKNFARGNVGEIAGILKAYRREQRMAPPGARPVIANDSELIIPTKAEGNVPNFRNGNASMLKVDNRSLETILTSILTELQTQTVQGGGDVGVVAQPVQNVEATINVNSEQNVRLTGAASIADSVAQAVKNSLTGFATEDQMGAISEQIMEFFEVLKSRGMVNSFGVGA